MQIPLQIAFRNMHPSDAVATLIREKAAKLERFYGRISSCRVMVEAPHRHRSQGKLFHVRIDLKVPGREIVAGGDTSGPHASEDIRVAIRETFGAVLRQLQDYVRTQPRQLHRVQEGAAHGRVLRIIREGGGDYGFLQAADGQEIYFHQNAVLDNHFDELKPGMEVRFTLADGEGEDGPQASTVEMAGKNNHQLAV